MLRALFFLVAIAILVFIVLVATNVINVRQTREAVLPSVGQTPAFDVNVNPVNVGTTTENVQLPVVRMENRQVEVPSIDVGTDSNSQ